jgi:N-acetylmuramoyl-L-alanine amidase
MLETAALCLALNVFHEARNQSYLGQRAVAVVTLNRAEYRAENVCKVVFKRKQFSWANSLSKAQRANPESLIPKELTKPDSDAWEAAKTLSEKALRKPLRVPKKIHASKHYHANYVLPTWALSMKLVAVIDDHHFYVPKNLMKGA